MKKELDNIHNNHRKRLRKRYIREGIDNFEDHEVLEMLLHYTRKYVDTNETAHRLINDIGSFSGVLDADLSELTKVNGIGERSATFLKLMRAFLDYYISEKKERVTHFRTIQFVAEYCIGQYRNVIEETHSVMLFDVSDKLLGFEKLHNSSIFDVDSLIKELGKYVFSYNANGFIIVRNTMDDNLSPTLEEMEACYEISNFFQKFNRKLYEYFIISKGKYLPVCKYASENY